MLSALQLVAGTCVVFERPRRPRDVPLRFDKALAGIQRLDDCQTLAFCPDHRCSAGKDAAAFGRNDPAPLALERASCSEDRGIDVLRVAGGNLREDPAGSRIEDVHPPPLCRRQSDTVDHMAVRQAGQRTGCKRFGRQFGEARGHQAGTSLA